MSKEFDSERRCMSAAQSLAEVAKVLTYGAV